MTQQEFENLTHRTTTTEDYRIIENLYLAAGNMDKKEFCEELKAMCAYDYANDQIELRQCLREIGRCVGGMDAENRALQMVMKTRNEELAEFLIGKAHAYNDTDFRSEAVKLIGEAAVVKMTIDMGFQLWDEDKKYVRNLLDEQCGNGKMYTNKQ